MALPTSIEAENPGSAQSKHLLLGTVSFTVCFAAWGLISAFAPHFRQQFHLSATQTAFLVAVPVLLGALARLPIGMLADRFGGRAWICLGILRDPAGNAGSPAFRRRAAAE